MLSYDIKGAKNLFFDRKAVTDAVDRAERRNLVRAGALVRTVSKRSMKPARRLRITEIPENRRHLFVKDGGRDDKGRFLKNIKLRELPWAKSRPGEPPRVRRGDIKKNVFFLYEPRNHSVIVGPTRLARSRNVLSSLEYGGRSDDGKRVLARPFMRPADQKSRSTYVQFWKDSVS